jgi:hypothetical protein
MFDLGYMGGGGQKKNRHESVWTSVVMALLEVMWVMDTEACVNLPSRKDFNASSS